MNNKVVVAILLVAVAAAGIGVGLFLADSPEPEKTTFSVIYDGNGGDCSVKDTNEYESGDVADVMYTPVPTKAGYIFMGWSLEKEDGALDFDKNQGNDTVKVNDDVRLYAVYRPDDARLDVGTYLKLDAKVSVESDPSISCVGYMKVSIISKSNGFNTVKTELKVDLMDGVDRIDTIVQDDISTTEPTAPSDGDIIGLEYGTYFYKGESVPVQIITSTSFSQPGVTLIAYQDLYESIVYCMVMEYGPDSGIDGMKMTFELSEYELRYTEPVDEGKYHVFYDGNGGISTVGDGKSYNKGDKVTLRFEPIPYKEGYRFCGWSEDKNSQYPEYDNTRELYETEMGSDDKTLYAVYSKYLDNAAVGSWFDYKITETFEDSPDYVCVVKVKATVSKVYDGGMIYSVSGTQTVTDSTGTTVEDIEETFDTGVDWWGYNEGEMELIDGYYQEFELGVKKLPAYCMEYDGIDYLETCTDVYGYYDDVLYSSMFEAIQTDNTWFHADLVLTGYELL